MDGCKRYVVFGGVLKVFREGYVGIYTERTRMVGRWEVDKLNSASTFTNQLFTNQLYSPICRRIYTLLAPLPDNIFPQLMPMHAHSILTVQALVTFPCGKGLVKLNPPC